MKVTWELVDMIFWLVCGICDLEGGFMFQGDSGWLGCSGLRCCGC